MKRLSLALILFIVLAACESRPPLSSMDEWVLEQDMNCQLHGRPTDLAEQMGIPITDCAYYIAEAKKIRER